MLDNLPSERHHRLKVCATSSLSLCILSKAFWKSVKLMYLCQSVHYSTIIRKANIWPAQPLPLRNPACSFLSCWSTALNILWMLIFAKILHGVDKGVMPRQLLQSFDAPFLGFFKTTPLVQLSNLLLPHCCKVGSLLKVQSHPWIAPHLDCFCLLLYHL